MRFSGVPAGGVRPQLGLSGLAAWVVLEFARKPTNARSDITLLIRSRGLFSGICTAVARSFNAWLSTGNSANPRNLPRSISLRSCRWHLSLYFTTIVFSFFSFFSVLSLFPLLRIHARFRDLPLRLRPRGPFPPTLPSSLTSASPSPSPSPFLGSPRLGRPFFSILTRPCRHLGLSHLPL